VVRMEVCGPRGGMGGCVAMWRKEEARWEEAGEKAGKPLDRPCVCW